MHARAAIRSLGCVVLGFACAVACGGDGETADGGSGGRGGEGGSGEGGSAGADGGDVGTDEYLTELATAADFAALSGEGAEVKYLATVEGVAAPGVFGGADCLFQNTSLYDYHLFFLRTFPEYAELSPARYEDLVLRRSSRVMWGGALKLYAETPHPVTGEPGVVAYSLYTGSIAEELPTIEDLVEVDRKLEESVPFAADRLVFVPDPTFQGPALEPRIEELLEAGVVLVPISALRPGLAAETYSEAEGYGYLTFATADTVDELAGPRSILAIDAAPNDLGIVAGLVTRQPQSVASHLNLRLREKGVPNASAPGVLDSPLVAGFADRLVHLVASGAEVQIEPAALAEAEAFWNAQRPPLGAPELDLEVNASRPFSEIAAADKAAFGVKVANLGELHALLEPSNRVEGFGLPFRFYVDFLEASGLDEEIEALLADPRVSDDAAYRRARLSALRQRIRAQAPLPVLTAELERAILESYGEAGLTTRLRFRSSTNAEDLPGVSGAGLYDSRSGCLADDLDGDDAGPSACLNAEDEAYLLAELERRERELVEFPEREFLHDVILDLEQDLAEEKSAYGAVLRVWSSLFNERAFEDREYYGIDHRSVAMALAVHPTFVGERLESVVITELEPDAEEPLYRVVSQAGEVGVVRPVDPTALAEILTFRRSAADEPSEVTLVQPSSLVPPGEELWPEPARSELARLLFAIQDHFAANVYPDLEPLHLDLEIDVTRDGRTVVKQVRPYTP